MVRFDSGERTESLLPKVTSTIRLLCCYTSEMSKYGVIVIILGLMLVSAATLVATKLIQLHPVSDVLTPNVSTRPDEEATGSTPTQSARAYNEAGYSIEIPSDFIYSRSTELGTNYETWHSRDDALLIRIQWETASPNSKIKATEDTNILINERAKPPISIFHPTIKGANSSAMFEKPLPSPEFYGVYLFVEAANGDIYEIDGIAFTPAAKASVRQLVASFSLAPA